MKSKLHSLFILFVLLALSTLSVQISTAHAQGATAFTYQGQLHDTGTNANGTYTMIFVLYTAASGGTPIGTNTVTPTLVNGLFSVNLDFGNVFNGSAYWLDITITNNDGTSQELSPRVQVLPTPYALFAANANVSANATTANSINSGNWSTSVGNYQGNNGIVSNAFLIYDNGLLVMELSTNGSTAPGMSAIPDHLKTFNNTSTMTVPTNVTKMMVEVWGAGGGGGGGGNGAVYSDGTFSGGPGGGGGGGGYGKGLISVIPGSTLTVIVGAGGAGGSNGSSGYPGGTSAVTNSTGILISATGGGGGGGGGASYDGGNGSYGNGGNPGTSSASISINGGQGGGGPNTASVAPGGSGAQGGAGGVGGSFGSFPGSLQVGQSPGGGGASGAGQYGTSGTSGNSGAGGMVVIYY